MKRIHVGLVGHGTVGSGVARLLQTRRGFFQSRHHTDFVLAAVCDRDPRRVGGRYGASCRTTADFHEILADPRIEVVVELMGGRRPARDLVLGALRSGKHVVTANKELIAHDGPRIFETAVRHNRRVYFESSVMAGVPVIKTINEGLAGNIFQSLHGIVNGTCNHILSEMARKGYSFEQALADAQEKGFAERDPSLDVNGMDAAHKLVILTALAFGRILAVKEIAVEGITRIGHEDILYTGDLGLVVKLLAIAKRDGERIEARVHPALIPDDHPLAAIQGVNNALFMRMDPMGEVLMSGRGAGSMPAASGVVSDLINLAAHESGQETVTPDRLYRNDGGLRLKPFGEVASRFYIRLAAQDKPGVLSRVTGVLGRHGISIHSVTQRAHGRMPAVPVVLLTDTAPEKRMQTALGEIARLSSVKGRPVVLRIEEV